MSLDSEQSPVGPDREPTPLHSERRINGEQVQEVLESKKPFKVYQRRHGSALIINAEHFRLEEPADVEKVVREYVPNPQDTRVLVAASGVEYVEVATAERLSVICKSSPFQSKYHDAEVEKVSNPEVTKRLVAIVHEVDQMLPDDLSWYKAA